MMNEEIGHDGQHLIHLGQASTAGTSTARTWIYTKVHLEKKMGTRTTWAAPDVHQCGGDVNHSQQISSSNVSAWVKEGLVRLPLR